jgi:plasmid stabilization system protein ParE
LRVAFSSAARRDLLEVEAWYRPRSSSALASFIRELNAALRFIADYPEGAPLFLDDARGKTLSRFPYSVVYKIKRDRILVLAIVDERRKPGTYADHFR